MLYNPNWKRDKYDLLTLNNLIAWLETQPPEKHYDLLPMSNCLLGQWLRSLGIDDLSEVANASGQMGERGELYGIAYHDDAQDIASEYFTFGAALKRAYAIRCS